MNFLFFSGTELQVPGKYLPKSYFQMEFSGLETTSNLWKRQTELL